MRGQLSGFVDGDHVPATLRQPHEANGNIPRITSTACGGSGDDGSPRCMPVAPATYIYTFSQATSQQARIRGSELAIVPPRVDRLIVHQIDLARPSPGGIDTCLRGIAKYAPEELALAFIGVDTGAGPSTRRLGSWEVYHYGDRTVWFLPVAKVDPGNQRRRIPHSLRLALGAVRFLRQIPKSVALQTHRMDIGMLATLINKPLVYLVHTQRGGLTGKTSDSFWRFASALHERLEKIVVSRASDVVVFNEEYSATVRTWNDAARFSPTWWDPELIRSSGQRDVDNVCWVGRLETPKDPELAILAFEELLRQAPERNWSLSMLGSGTLAKSLEKKLESMSSRVKESVTLHGRVDPAEVARIMSRSQAFLMTSHAGYEGYPRVLVEALASGLPAVVTAGSDTGGIVDNGKNGFVTDRVPSNIARSIVLAADLKQSDAMDSVKHLSAPTVVREVMYPGGRG